MNKKLTAKIKAAPLLNALSFDNILTVIQQQLW